MKKIFYLLLTFLGVKDPYALAKGILGKDFISPKSVKKSRKGIFYTKEQLSRFRETVPAPEVLRWCRDNNYMLVPGPNRPMSLLEICTMKNGYVHPKEGGWDDDQKDKVETRWYMIRKNLVPESTFKNWEEQQPLISGVETVPNSAEFTWAITTYKAVRGVYLFGGIYVRTSSFDPDGDYISVGDFDGNGLSVSSDWDIYRLRNLGLSVARKGHLIT